MTDVAISGGGPVGMGLAIELAQRGVEVCVVERMVEPSPIPKGQNLTQRTAEHFKAWGCEAELRAAFPIPEGAGIGGMTAYGTLLGEHHYDWLNRARVKDFYAAANARLPQYATERVLRDRAAALGVEMLLGWKATGLEQDADGATLTAEPIGGGCARTIRAAYAVGCDGARSVVREAAGIGQVLRDHDRTMALVVFTSTELDELLKRYPGKAFYNVLHPELEGYWLFFGRVEHGRSFFFHAPLPEGASREGFDFAGMIHRAVGQPFDLTLDHVGFWDLRVAWAESYRAGRVFVAGDAAHSHPPYGGYGINTGLEDARNLGWKLAATLQGWGGEGLLGSYDAERRPVFASTAGDFIERFIREDRDFLAAHSPEADADFAALWAARADAAEVDAFEPNYEGSPLIGGPGTPSARGSHEVRARAGHHLTPLPLPDGRGAFDALGDGFTLISAGADPAPWATAARERGVPLAVVRGGRDAGEAWEAGAVLVRPDGYVAHAVRPGAAEEPGAVLDRARGAGRPRAS